MNVAKAKFLVVRRHWTQVGEKRERERIIELLKSKDSICVEWALAVIKGEVK